jgi:oxygen-independent coproporphyrinogen-3 oxidase
LTANSAALSAPRPTYRHVYLHVPFCSRRCSYCDFSIAVRKRVPADRFSTSVGREIDARVASGQLSAIDTLYLGGGTPSRLGAAGMDRLLAEVRSRGATLTPGAEVTIEANPEDLTGSTAERWLAAGVNRLSIGIQSFSPAVLDWMHRSHTAAQAATAVRTARSAGFENVSIDLIYAVPAALNRDWDADLGAAIEVAPDHLSVYGLTIEPRTPLGRWAARGEVIATPDDRAADEFQRAHERLAAAGFEHYEVSNYARPGLRSRHNSSYWQRVPYLGLGPSAHSFDGVERRWNVEAYAEWAIKVDAGADPVAGRETLTDEQRRDEAAYLGLRTDAGAELAAGDEARVATWVAEGWAVRAGTRVRLTPTGWLRLDALTASLRH